MAAYRQYRKTCAKGHVLAYIHVSRWMDLVTYIDENMNNRCRLSLESSIVGLVVRSSTLPGEDKGCSRSLIMQMVDIF
jgi:hypothetical protein